MSQARGALHVTTGGALALLASTWTLIGAGTIPALVTPGEGLSDFDVPAAGRLRYIGLTARSFGVRANVTVAGLDASAEDFAFRLAKSGVTLEASEQTRSLWSFLGFQGVTLEALTTLAPGDYLEVYVEASGAASLSIDEIGLVAVATELQDDAAASGAPAGGQDWAFYEDLLERELIGSVLSEEITFTPTGEAGATVRATYSTAGLEVTAGEIAIATQSPRVGVRVADLPQYPEPGFGVRARGIDYEVRDGGVIPYGGGEHVELLLEEA